jgi:4'-phosphopantetheinyl transferase
MSLGDDILGPGETARSSADMLRYWTRKESLVKATGDGIAVGMRSVLVTEPDDPPVALAYPGRPDFKAQMADLVCRPGYLASIAVLTAGPMRFVERWHDLDAENV